MGRGFSLALLVLLVVLPASGHAGSTRPAGTTCQAGDTLVTIANFSFTPSELTINQGDTVCWTNMVATQHTATSDPGDPASFGPARTERELPLHVHYRG
jgi:plastocyanin